MKNQEDLLQSILTPSLRIFFSGFFMVELSDMYALFIPLLMSELGATVVDIGLVYSVAGIFPLGFQFWRLAVRSILDGGQAISWGNLFRLVTFVGNVLADQWQWMFVMYAFQGIGVGIAGPSYTAYIADSTAEGHRAKVFAVQQNIRNVLDHQIPPCRLDHCPIWLQNNDRRRWVRFPDWRDRTGCAEPQT